MVSGEQRLLGIRNGVLSFATAAVLAVSGQAQSAPGAKKFYSDDPLWQEPTPRSTLQVKPREVDDLYDFVENRFVLPARQDKLRKQGPITAGDINTLGEVPDSSWYTNRHWMRRMSIAELQRGPANSTPPEAEGEWQIVAAKTDGISAGFVIEDRQKHRYVLKCDPPDFPELASAADVISSKFFYALGYNTPENYIVHFSRERLTVGKGVMWKDASGKKQPLTARAVDKMLQRQPKDSRGAYRALASHWISGELVGPFSYQGTRSDDPNDIVAHENRRELRGLRVFAAWLNHTDVKQMNTMDTLVTENGRRYLKHYLIDFGSTLGSDANFPKNAWRGHVYPISPGAVAAKQMLTLGLYVPSWLHAHYPKLRGAGGLEAQRFEPESWIPDYPNPAFLMMDDEDAFWAAKQVAAFTDEEIRAIVDTGEFTDHRTAEWITECLINRRDKIVRTWLTKSLPIDRFRVEAGTIAFDRLSPAIRYDMHWYTYDNDRNVFHPIANAAGSEVPSTGDSAAYLAAVVQCTGEPACPKPVTVYVRLNGSAVQIVGVDRRAQSGVTSGQIAVH